MAWIPCFIFFPVSPLFWHFHNMLIVAGYLFIYYFFMFHFVGKKQDDEVATAWLNNEEVRTAIHAQQVQLLLFYS